MIKSSGFFIRGKGGRMSLNLLDSDGIDLGVPVFEHLYKPELKKSYIEFAKTSESSNICSAEEESSFHNLH